ncbi:MAG TPA: SRPBCC family protein [Ktedonobacteraceae bacterium]|nr:SRPBCC family protein [Ktedonobacteraceae bacterium]
MAEHHVSVTVNAPVHQVYTLFTHFNDFPKFMSFVKEVTYYDDQRSHWVAQILGRHEWDAINENWIEDRQIGWRSTSGPENTGKVKFLSTVPIKPWLMSIFTTLLPLVSSVKSARNSVATTVLILCYKKT